MSDDIRFETAPDLNNRSLVITGRRVIVCAGTFNPEGGYGDWAYYLPEDRAGLAAALLDVDESALATALEAVR